MATEKMNPEVGYTTPPSLQPSTGHSTDSAVLRNKTLYTTGGGKVSTQWGSLPRKCWF